MIAGEDQHLRIAQARRQRLLDQTDHFGQFFELTESAERLGLLVDFCLQRGGELRVDGLDIEV